jgi:hypothetical protein
VGQRDITSELQSTLGVRSHEANKVVARKCLQRPDLLKDIAKALTGPTPGIVADCAEVMTEVAREKPELVVPYADALISLLDSKNGRARWEAMHAIEFIAALIPKTIERLLPKLESLIRDDKSVIVRDNATSTLANYASLGKREALQAYPLLLMTLELWREKQALRVLEGLQHVARHAPKLGPEIRRIAEENLTSPRTSARKEAARLLKALS